MAKLVYMSLEYDYWYSLFGLFACEARSGPIKTLLRKFYHNVSSTGSSRYREYFWKSLKIGIYFTRLKHFSANSSVVVVRNVVAILICIRVPYE